MTTTTEIAAALIALTDAELEIAITDAKERRNEANRTDKVAAMRFDRIAILFEAEQQTREFRDLVTL